YPFLKEGARRGAGRRPRGGRRAWGFRPSLRRDGLVRSKYSGYRPKRQAGMNRPPAAYNRTRSICKDGGKRHGVWKETGTEGMGGRGPALGGGALPGGAGAWAAGPAGAGRGGRRPAGAGRGGGGPVPALPRGGAGGPGDRDGAV